MKEDNIIANNEFVIEDIYEIGNKAQINEIISFKIEASAENFEIINIKEGRNTRGEAFDGKRIVIFVSLKIDLKYTTYKSSRVLFEDKENKTFLYSNCAKEIDGIDIEELKRKRKIKIQIDVDKINIKKLDEKTIIFKVLGKTKLIKI